MGSFGNSGVMVAGFWLILLSLAILSLTATAACPPGQFHSERLQQCINCTDCTSKGLVVLRPCQVHRDVTCISLSNLLKNYVTPIPESHHLRHGKKHHRSRQQGDSNSDGKHGVVMDTVTSTEVPFSGAEELVWDWQAIALTLAVFACILFFLVIALYSLHQAKQWRRLKENFDADVEELSARLSLMAATSSEKGEILEPSLGPIHDGNYLTNRCVYLEQLLNVRKDKKIGSKGGNVYIEESANNGGNTTNNGKT